MPLLLVEVFISAFFGAIWADSNDRSPLVWGLLSAFLPLMIFIAVASQRKNWTLDDDLDTGESSGARREAYDREKWDSLVKFDSDIATAAGKLHPYGQRYVDELAETYLALGDKASLADMTSKILAAAEADWAEEQAASRGLTSEFSGYSFRIDEHGRFVAEARPGSNEFWVFPSRDIFEEAVRTYNIVGEPPVRDAASGPA